MQPHIAIQIFSVLACMAFPVLFMVACMRADAPSYEANWPAVFIVTVISFYPLILALIYFFQNWTLFGIPALPLVVIAFVVGVGSMAVSGAAIEGYDLIRGIKWNGLSIAGDQVYYAGELVSDADAKTAVMLGNSYWKDKSKAYYRTKVVAGVDVATARVVGHYLVDRDSVFSQEEKSPASADGFENLNDYYVKDRKNVYAGRTQVKGADPTSFRPIKKELKHDGEVETREWAVDKDHVYTSRGDVIEGADPKTYDQSFDDNSDVGRDSKNVFYVTQLVTGADLKKFVTLPYGYAKDANRVYYLSWVDDKPTVQIIGDADVRTFETLKREEPGFTNPLKPRKSRWDQPDARDSKGLFKKGNRVKADE